MKVLIADDSNLIRVRLQAIVSTFKQVELVATCSNGTETLEAIRTLKPDLAILDIKMPGFTGLEVLREIRKENKTLKVIILTFFPSDYHQQMAVEAGTDYFFSKVDEFEKVAIVVAELVDQEENDNRIAYGNSQITPPLINSGG